MGNVSSCSLKDWCLQIFVLSTVPFSNSLQNLSFDLELHPSTSGTGYFTPQHHASVYTGVPINQWLALWEELNASSLNGGDSVTTGLSKRLVKIWAAIPSCKLQDTKKLLYSTCFIFCGCIFSRRHPILLLLVLSFSVTALSFKVGAPYWEVFWLYQTRKPCFFFFLSCKHFFRIFFRIFKAFCSNKIQCPLALFSYFILYMTHSWRSWRTVSISTPVSDTRCRA